MTQMNIIEKIFSRLDTINKLNGVNFTARLNNNYIYIDKSENMITSYYCRIELDIENNLMDVQFYHPQSYQFKSSNTKLELNLLLDRLESILIKDTSIS